MNKIASTAKVFWPVIVGAAIGIGWFVYNLSLPGAWRGLGCCDAAEYISLGLERDVYSITTQRTFGYPVFLSYFHRLYNFLGIYGPYDWVYGVAVAQVTIWFISATILFCVLRQTDKKYPWPLLGIVLAHPSFSSYASLTLTDVLGSSLFCIALACIVKIFNGAACTLRMALGAGLAFGLGVSMRPNLQLVALALPCLLSVGLLIQGIQARKSFRAISKTIIMTVLCYGIGFAPLYYKVLSNCHNRFGTWCVIDPSKMVYAKKQTIIWGLINVRMWSSLWTGFKGTSDDYFARFASSCTQTLGPIENTSDPSKSYIGPDWLIKCLAQNPMTAIPFFLKKLISGFDNYFLNGYSTDQTTVPEFYFNHVFSVFGFLGFFTALLHCFRATCIGTLPQNMHLVTSLVYVACQCVPHVEPRYFFPVYPVFNLLFFSSVYDAIKSGWIRRINFTIFYSLLAAVFFIQTRVWNLTDCLYMHERIQESLRYEGMFTECPSMKEVQRQQAIMDRIVPTWPWP